ncbi:unnamed protein product [Parnassius apollo]|uniref:(apollo) hypothetical protein n=1 Tax=Parnassius apollo TaxID=110799 RepID=A0A8S3XR43_PARAO|nr:unnamed protein product [Parnassius apollo]
MAEFNVSYRKAMAMYVPPETPTYVPTQSPMPRLGNLNKMPQLPEPIPGTINKFFSNILPVQENSTPVTYAQAVSSSPINKNKLDSRGEKYVRNDTTKKIKKRIQEPNLEEYIHDGNMSTESESSANFIPKPYWNPDLSHAVAERRLALKTFRQNSTPANLNRLQEKTRKAQKLIRNAKSKGWWEFCTSLNEISSASEMWRKMQWLKGYRSVKPQIEKSIAESLLCNLTPDYVSQPYPGYTSQNPKLETEISRSELYKCLKSKDTCPGTDDISYSMLLNLPIVGQNVLLNLYNIFFTQSFAPYQWVAIGESGSKWLCPECTSIIPKGGNLNTPVRGPKQVNKEPVTPSYVNIKRGGGGGPTTVDSIVVENEILKELRALRYDFNCRLDRQAKEYDLLQKRFVVTENELQKVQKILEVVQEKVNKIDLLEANIKILEKKKEELESICNMEKSQQSAVQQPEKSVLTFANVAKKQTQKKAADNKSVAMKPTEPIVHKQCIVIDSQNDLTDITIQKENKMETKRKLVTTRSGSSTDDIFKPNWFAYELMDRFLAPIYDKSDTVTINTETMEFPNEDSNQDRSFSNEGSIQNRSSTSAKKRRESEVTEVRAQVKTAVNVLKNLSDRPRTEVDEVDLYCQLLAKKIKKFNEQQREVIMHDIDELIYQKRNESYLNINSPARSSTYSYVRSTPDSVRFTPTPSPSSQMLAYDMSTRDSVRYAPITSPSPQVMPSPSYHVADDYSDYTVVSPNHSQVEYVTGSSTSTTSTPKVTIISNDIISQAFTLSQIQNKN